MKKRFLISGALLATTFLSTEVVKAAEVTDNTGADSVVNNTQTDVTIQDVEAAKQELQSAEQQLTATNNSVDATKASVTAAEQSVSTATAKVQEAEANANAHVDELKVAVDAAKSELDAAQGNVATAEQLSPSQADLDSRQQSVSSKTEELKQANSNKASVETELAAAEEAVVSAQAAVTTSETNLKNASEALAEAKNNQVASDANVSQTNYELDGIIDLGEYKNTYVNAIQERSKLHQKLDGKDENYQPITPLAFDSAENQNNLRTLEEVGEKLLAINTYDGSKDIRPVNALSMTEEQFKELNMFGVDLANQIRKAVGGQEVVSPVGMFNFAVDITKAVHERDAREKDQQTTYNKDIILEALRKNNIDPTASELNGQRPASLISLSYWVQNSGMQYQEDMVVNPESMTMGQLKELIYSGFVRGLFTHAEPELSIDASGNKTWAASRQRRLWEHALNLTGLELRRTPEYQPDTMVSVALSFVKNKYSNKNEYYVLFNHYQDSYKLSSENRAYKNRADAPGYLPGFDTTLLKNIDGPITDIKVLEEAVKAAQTALSTAKSDLDSKIAIRDGKKVELETLNTSISNLQNSLKECEDKLAILISQLTEKNAKIAKAKAELEVKTEAYEVAKKNYDNAVNATTLLEVAKQELADAQSSFLLEQTKLATLQVDQQAAEQAYKAAKENYENLRVLYDALNPAITSKGNQTPLTHSLPEANVDLKEILFETIYQYDPTLEFGKEVVVHEGQNGSVQVITIGNQVTEIVLIEKVDKVVNRGTLVKPEVKPELKQDIINISTSKVEGVLSSDSTEKLPATGDESSISTVLGLGLLSTAIFISKRRRKAEF
ncbi:G5 domain-containing protein [Streptococcus sp. A18]|uniref:G5 domain-containing protein n=1 Tax=Streptococcus sp. A18 TaxID=3373125 RepID=UPI00374D214D